MMGLTRGTRHYIQFKLAEGDTWQDLVFENPESHEISGLWASRSYAAARNKIVQLSSDSDNPLSNYRVVKRTWQEEIIEHNPNLGQFATSLAYDEDDADPSAGDYSDDDDEHDSDADEDAEHEAALELQVGEVPDTGDDTPQFEVVDESTNPLIK